MKMTMMEQKCMLFKFSPQKRRPQAQNQQQPNDVSGWLVGWPRSSCVHFSSRHLLWLSYCAFFGHVHPTTPVNLIFTWFLWWDCCTTMLNVFFVFVGWIFRCCCCFFVESFSISYYHWECAIALSWGGDNVMLVSGRSLLSIEGVSNEDLMICAEFKHESIRSC